MKTYVYILVHLVLLQAVNTEYVWNGTDWVWHDPPTTTTTTEAPVTMPLYNGYEQAEYTVVNTFDGYEERVYPTKNWACSSRTYDLKDADSASKEMFMNLFGYISGKSNTQGTKIPMTVPVVTEHTPLLDGNIVTGRRSKMCFYIGKDHQDNPPEPGPASILIPPHDDHDHDDDNDDDDDNYANDDYDDYEADDVFIFSDPPPAVEVEPRSMSVFVETYPGYMEDCDWAKKIGSFAKKLRGHHRDHETTSYMTVGYDSPWRFWNRRNEVMLKKKVIIGIMKQQVI